MSRVKGWLVKPLLNRGTMALKTKVAFPYPPLNLLLQNIVDVRGKNPVMSSSESPVPNVFILWCL